MTKNKALESLLRNLEKKEDELSPERFKQFLSGVKSSADRIFPSYLDDSVGVAYFMFNRNSYQSGELEQVPEESIRAYLPIAITSAGFPEEVIVELERGTRHLPKGRVMRDRITEVKELFKSDRRYGPAMSMTLRYPGKTNVEAARALSDLFHERLSRDKKSPLYDNETHGDIVWQDKGCWTSTLQNPKMEEL